MAATKGVKTISYSGVNDLMPRLCVTQQFGGENVAMMLNLHFNSRRGQVQSHVCSGKEYIHVHIRVCLAGQCSPTKHKLTVRRVAAWLSTNAVSTWTALVTKHN
jgi:hypothetical protein